MTNEHSVESKRLDNIDVSKGIGILLVILGHLITYGSPVSSIIYSFHMPFFFFVSGIFANAHKKPFVRYILDHSKRLLIPYIIVFLLGVIISLSLNGLNIKALKSILSQFLYAAPESMYVGQIWFLVCLFNVIVLFYPFYKLVLSKNNFILSALMIFLCAFVAWFVFPLVSAKFYVFNYFKFGSSIMALAFYSLGFEMKDVIKKINIKKADNIVLLVICFFIIILSYRLNGNTNLAATIYNNLMYYLLFAFCGSVLLILVGLILQKSKFLAYIGRNSLFIFTLHSIPLFIYTYILSIISGKKKINGDNLSNIEVIIGFVIIVLVMTLSCLLYNLIKSKIFKKLNKQ